MKKIYVSFFLLFMFINVSAQLAESREYYKNQVKISELIKAKKYSEALKIIRYNKNQIIKKDYFNNENLFYYYSIYVDNEARIFENQEKIKEKSIFLNKEANRVRNKMYIGNDKVASFYFSTKYESIRAKIEANNDSSSAYQEAATRYKELYNEWKYVTFNSLEKKIEIRDEIVEDYFFNIHNAIHKSNTESKHDYRVLKNGAKKLLTLVEELNGFKTSIELENEIRDELLDKYYYNSLMSLTRLAIKNNYNIVILKKNKKELLSLLQQLETFKISKKLSDEIFKKINDAIKENQKLIDLKEFAQGKYQTYLKNTSKINSGTVKKDFLYFLNKLSGHNTTLGMYFTEIKRLKALLVEVNQSASLTKEEQAEIKYSIFSSLSGIYELQGNYEELPTALENTLKYYHQQPQSKKHSAYEFMIYWRYASFYLNQNQYDKAKEYLDKMLRIETDFENNKYYLMAMSFHKMKEYTRAIQFYQKAILSCKNSKKSDEECFLASIEWYLSKAYLGENKLHQALLFSKKAYNSNKKLKNKYADNKDVNFDIILLYVLADQSIILSKQGNQNKADEKMQQFLTAYQKYFFESLLYSTNDNRNVSINKNEYSPSLIFYYLYKRRQKTGNTVAYGYNYALLSKELLLNTANIIRKNSSIDKIPELKEINNKLEKVNTELKKINVKNRDSLLDYARVYEKELIARGKKDIVTLFKNSQITYKDVQKQLKENEAAIEFVSFSPYQFEKDNNEVFYGAFILRKNDSYPTFIKLFNEKELSNIINENLLNKASENKWVSEMYGNDGEKLYDLIWKPLEPYLSKVKKVYFSPSAMLHSISFAALKTNSNGGRLIDKFDLIQLSSTKKIKDSKVAYGIKKALIFGDIAFDVTATEKPNQIDNKVNLTRSGDFRELSGTQKEIEEINRVLKNNNIQTLKYAKLDATEGNLVKQVGSSPQILHISTHAFYLKPIDEESLFMSDFLGFAKLKGDNNPMNRSGLAMAGANYFWKYGNKIKKNEGDGILTANEISNLPLQSVELAVLSACETALGKSTGNEGVFGLQRGLKMAGVKNLLLSLWKVDDAITQEYMVDFYKNLIENKMSIQEAYFKTQKLIKKKYPNPYYWSAFVLVR